MIFRRSPSISTMVPLLVGLFVALALVATFSVANKTMKDVQAQHAATMLRDTLTRAQGVIEADMRDNHLVSTRRYIAGFGSSLQYQLVFLAGPDGKVIASTDMAIVGSPWQTAHAKNRLKDVIGQLGTADVSITFNDDETLLTGLVRVCGQSNRAASFTASCGFLFVQQSVSVAYRGVQDVLFFSTVEVLLAIALITLMLLLSFHTLLSRPVGHILKVLRKVTAGNRKVRVGLRGKGDIATLGRGINEMLDRLQEDSEALRKFSLAIEQSPTSIVITDTNGCIEYVNPKFEDVTGYSFNEVFGRNPRFLQSGLTPREVYIQLWTALKSGSEWRGELYNKRKDGTIFCEAATISAVCTPDGTPTHYLAIKEDITEQKAIEKELNRFGRLIEQSLSEVYIFDAETFKFVQVNKGGRENLGYTMAELRGMAAFEIKPDFSKEDFSKLVLPLINREQDILVFETVHQRKDGSRYEVEVHLQLLHDETPPVFVANIRDISEQKALTAQLVQAQKMEMVGQLTGGIAHDFNNILGIILGNLELLERMLQGNDKALARVGRSLAGARRGADLIDKLLGFARKKSPRTSFININTTIIAMQDLFVRSLTKDITIENRLDDELWPILVDVGEFENVILNLALNARDAMAGVGKLTIETKNETIHRDMAGPSRGIIEGDFVVVSVSDTGEGMTQETVDRVIEPFFTTKSQGKGTGLGLSTVYGFIQRSKGYLEILSEVNIGTSCRMYFPRVMEDTEKKPRSQIHKKSADHQPTILVVDDEEAMREIALEYLEANGYNTVVAENGVSALEILKINQSIDLLFSDIMMPGGIDGYLLAKAAVEICPGIKILLTTGFSKELDIETADERKSHKHTRTKILRKPFTEKQLIRLIRDLLGR